MILHDVVAMDFSICQIQSAINSFTIDFYLHFVKDIFYKLYLFFTIISTKNFTLNPLSFKQKPFFFIIIL